MMNILRLLVVLPLLAYASLTDVRERRVSNKLILSITIFAVIFLAIEGIINGIGFLKPYIIPIILIGIIAHLGYSLKIYGDADAKGFTAIAIMFPYFAISILINSFLIACVGIIGYTLLTRKFPKTIPFFVAITISVISVISNHDLMWQLLII